MQTLAWQTSHLENRIIRLEKAIDELKDKLEKKQCKCGCKEDEYVKSNN